MLPQQDTKQNEPSTPLTQLAAFKLLTEAPPVLKQVMEKINRLSEKTKTPNQEFLGYGSEKRGQSSLIQGESFFIPLNYFPRSLFRTPKNELDRFTIHNHPGGTTFSDGDVDTYINLSPDLTNYLMPTPPTEPKLEGLKLLNPEYNKTILDALGPEETHLDIRRDILRILADDNLIDYSILP